MKSSRLHLVRLAAVLASALAVFGAVAGVASADPTSDYQAGLALGTKAYQYGVPLLDMQRVFTSGTSTKVCNPVTGHGPVNLFCSIRNVASASERTVNAPNVDTPYSMAWLDVSKQPQVLHAPAIKHRFWEFELLDPWTNNFYNITSAHLQMGRGDFNVTDGGNWAVAGPGFRGKVPRGVKLIRSRYNRVWVIGRTYLAGPSDLANVHKIQNQYTIEALSAFKAGRRPTSPKYGNAAGITTTIPGTQPGEDPLDFYVALGREMLKFPAPARDQPLLAQLRVDGIGPGLDPGRAGLSAATLQGLRDAVTQGPNKVTAAALGLYLKGFAEHNGYLISDLGDWGTNYELRAIGDRVGLGGQRASIATYPVALLDDTKAPLTGSKRYVLHIPKSSLPIPVKAFWSLTMYDTNSFFVPNPINRYAITNLTRLHKNPDGSIDIYVQNARPSNPLQAQNWLPAPPAGAGFRLVWRLYDLDHALSGVLDGSGWQPPPILPCDATGHASNGTACAS